MSGRSPRWFTGIKYPYETNFADNTWAQIIAVCQKNIVPPTWKVGDQKTMMIGSMYYLVDIIGINHDDYSDGFGKAPFTFQLHACYGELKNMNSSRTNNGGWTSCAMRQTHLPAILSKMPTEVRNNIREVNKLTSAGNQSATINTTADKLFLLSEIEIFGSITHSYSGEGTQYDYYKAGNNRAKDGADSWWERGPNDDRPTHFCFVLRGNASGSNANYATGVAFGFCF